MTRHGAPKRRKKLEKSEQKRLKSSGVVSTDERAGGDAGCPPSDDAPRGRRYERRDTTQDRAAGNSGRARGDDRRAVRDSPIGIDDWLDRVENESRADRPARRTQARATADVLHGPARRGGDAVGQLIRRFRSDHEKWMFEHIYDKTNSIFDTKGCEADILWLPSKYPNNRRIPIRTMGWLHEVLRLLERVMEWSPRNCFHSVRQRLGC